ncbi:MAG: tetratricopeptide repeat protein, partial [Ktedonobacteraceae bacterium]
MAQTTLREYLQITEDAINSGRVNEAFANCQYILTHFPELLEGRRLLGEIYLKQGHLDEAQQTFDWVLTNDPENVVSYCSRALISEQLKDYDTALDCYQQAYELSRGISHIRQEFNQLSEKVGQHGFIFSRAGLARLYMRGDLLPQAIQEWESVLAATPDRLDARTGLLETFWREGLYDRVEQLAKQILNEVPHCLKALVLLAHATFAQNALQSKELIEQAKALDPDLVIAQELFSDFMVSHPKDPFLTLLKQSPTVLSEEKQAEPTPVKTVQSVPVAANGTAATSTFSDPLVRWSSLDNIIEPQQEYQTMQEASSFGSWTSNSSSELNSWSLYGQGSEASGQRDVQAETVPATQPEQINNEISAIPEQPGTEQGQPWYHMDIFEEHNAESWNSALPP